MLEPLAKCPFSVLSLFLKILKFRYFGINQQQKHCHSEFKMCWDTYNFLVWIYIVVQFKSTLVSWGPLNVCFASKS